MATKGGKLFLRNEAQPADRWSHYTPYSQLEPFRIDPTVMFDPGYRAATARSNCGIVGPSPAPVRTMASEISCKSAVVSSSDAAPIQPSTCCGERPPTMAPVTPGHASTQAIATADTVVR